MWREYGYEQPTITETYQPDQLSVVVFVETEIAATTTKEGDGEAPKTGDVTPKTTVMATKSGEVALKDGGFATKTGEMTLKTDKVVLKDGEMALNSDELATKTGEVALKQENGIADMGIRAALLNLAKTRRTALREATIEKCSQLYLSLLNNPSMSSEDVARKVGLPPRSVDRYISLLKQANLLRREGPKNGGTWKFLI